MLTRFIPACSCCCRVLLWREFLSVTRNPADVAGRCLIFSWLAIFVGLIYYNLASDVDALRARLNVLFVEPVILLLLPYVYMSLYTADKQYYIADSSAKLYHPSAYYVAKQFAVMPFAILNVLLFSFTLYGLAGLRPDGWAIGMNGLMSVLMYLIAAQVGVRGLGLWVVGKCQGLDDKQHSICTY
jgi:ABC-type multidrug transport system permease subunit